MSLGSLFYEPVWLFYREAAAKEKLGSEQLESLAQLAQLKGWRVNIGAPGSGVTNLMLRLFDANGLAPQDLVVQR
ncbi:MAG: C4-dicarboxylate ABC transporter substrate-binding protein, partial [Methylibium sp.]|nr:C4-dicarboxylate ABC transporter substrate-binding protein [Methylibium sp.]